MSGVQQVIAELESLVTQAQQPRVQALLNAELAKAKAELQHEIELEKQAQMVVDTPTPPPTQPTPSVVATPIVTVPEALPVLMASVPISAPKKMSLDISKYAWDQSVQFVKIYATLSECGALQNRHCELQCTEKSLTLLVHAPSGREFRLALTPLGGEVVPGGCSVKAKENGSITVTLKKANSANWANVIQKKDDKKLPEFDKSEDPERGLMNMMQKMYQDGDDEMKRMMQKAWYESRSGKKPDFSDTQI